MIENTPSYSTRRAVSQKVKKNNLKLVVHIHLSQEFDNRASILFWIDLIRKRISRSLNDDNPKSGAFRRICRSYKKY